MTERKRDDLYLPGINVLARRVDPVILIEQFHADKIPHFAQVRLNHVDAVFYGCGERRAGRVDDKFGAELLRDRGCLRIEIVWHAGRQAAAAHDEFRLWHGGGECFETLTPFRFAQRQPRQDEAVLLRCAQFGDRKVFTSFGFGFNDAVRNILIVDEAAE